MNFLRHSDVTFKIILMILPKTIKRIKKKKGRLNAWVGDVYGE